MNADQAAQIISHIHISGATQGRLKRWLEITLTGTD